MISPDGNWRWNGREWQPVMQRRRRPSAWLVTCGVVAAVGLLGGGACLVALGSAGPRVAPAAEIVACSPLPCASASGFTVYVDRVEWRFAPSGYLQPEPGNQFARVSVRFENRAAGERHANPFQFVLLDQQGVKHAIAFVGDNWQAVNLTPGGRFGPRWLDFQVTQGTTAGTLVWTPDFQDHEIPLD